MKFPEHFRRQHPKLEPTKPGDPYGWFIVPCNGQVLNVLASAAYPEMGILWDHVSVSRPDRTPTWDEMCHVKNLFWSEDQCVVQFHPPKSDYVNFHPHCLHLWHWLREMPRPPADLVGPR